MVRDAAADGFGAGIYDPGWYLDSARDHLPQASHCALAYDSDHTCCEGDTRRLGRPETEMEKVSHLCMDHDRCL